MRFYKDGREVGLESLDLDKGRLEAQTMTRHVPAVQETEAQGCFDQSNGGAWVETHPYVAAVPEHNEEELVMVYVPFTAQELAAMEKDKARKDAEDGIASSQAFLKKTDYAVIKCAENGLDLDAEYPGLRERRQAARDAINALEATIEEG